jgi:hypothetical protein
MHIGLGFQVYTLFFLLSFKNFGSISPQKAMSVSIVYTSKVLVSTS